MTELTSILETWRSLAGDAGEAVLATVVHVEGSAYRRPGARMLVLPGGHRLGTISGGCLEAEVARKARWWTDGGAAIRLFDSSSEDAARDFGLGCDGVITVLLERLASTETRRLLEFLDAGTQRRLGAVVATVVRTDHAAGCGTRQAGQLELGMHFLFTAGGVATAEEETASCEVFHEVARRDVSRGISRDLAGAVAATACEKKSRLVHLPDADVFVEWVAPPQRLFVFGAGHDVIPLALLGDMMGWSVTIADTHASWLVASRFPRAHGLFVLPSSGEIAPLEIRPDDAVVMMTHNFPLDRVLLPQLIEAAPRYLGVLGSRSRAQKLFAESGADLGAKNVHAPVGLDVGAENPEAVAMAIAAEIQAVLQDRPGGRLRHRKGAIHSPVLEVGRAGTRTRHDWTIQPLCGLVHA